MKPSSEIIRDRIERARRRIDLLREADFHDPPRCRLVFGADGHQYALSGAMTEEAIAAVEREGGFALPEEYRAWLETMSNGGAGPYYGLYTLADALQPQDAFPQQRVVAYDQEGNELARASTGPRPVLDRASAPGKPFPFIEPWNPLESGFAIPNDANPFDGTLALAQQGCGMTSLLVLNGPHRGEVWSDCTSEGGGIAKEAPSFLDWIEAWLESALAEWVIAALPRWPDDRPLPAAAEEALPIVRAQAQRGHEGSWAALAYLHLRRGEFDQALTAADAMAEVAEAEPERRRAVLHAAIFNKARDLPRWLEAVNRGLAIEQGWASSKTALLRERVAVLRAMNSPDLDTAIEALAAHDVWSLEAQLDFARLCIRRRDIPAAIRRLDETLHETGVMETSRAAQLENAFLPLIESLERDGEEAAAREVRVALEGRLGEVAR